jgi:two-component sensor histidine kinase
MGVRPDYLPWEKYLTRKLNFITGASLAMACLAMLTYVCMGEYGFIKIHAIAILFFPAIFISNKFGNYIWGLYSFYISVLVLMFLFFQEFGESSQLYLFLVPLTISMLMLLQRKEIYKHVVVLLVVYFLFLLVVVAGYIFKWFQTDLPPETIATVRTINISLSSFLTLVVTYIIIRQNLKQELELTALIRQKETLLAEVNHRVKNNMNVITSLLNLKKELCLTNEALEALEDSKNRIYSMALIHQKVYLGNSINDVNFQEHISELAGELVSSYSAEEDVKLNINVDDCCLGLDAAIPCSLVINEVITNSLKHALTGNNVLELNVTMKKTANEIEMAISDNGPGLTDYDKMNKDTLGMTLIDLLCGQLDARYNFTNHNGLVFNMNFVLPKKAPRSLNNKRI